MNTRISPRQTTVEAARCQLHVPRQLSGDGNRRKGQFEPRLKISGYNLSQLNSHVFIFLDFSPAHSQRASLSFPILRLKLSPLSLPLESLSVSLESLLVHTVTLTGVSLLLSYRRRHFNVSRPSLGSSSSATKALVGSSSLVVFWFQVLAVASRRGSWTVVGSSLASSLVLFWGRVLFVTQSPLRFEIVNGVTEVEGIAEKKTAGAEEDEEKGVPAFWLNAMKNNEVLADEISEHDEGALKFLKDIKWSRIDNPKGFKFEFYFATNPYFTNTILTKTYHMIDEDEPILKKAIG
ncbi:hypothetical protein Ahy_A03g015748 [Arachis hypogaea]|uniref:Nucleosome assembly protein n=1 Tax=Arachis hypogaea TaxID=3818 RepID=A0A445E1L3_ARAHY|nr:hypothetical protein Ahy_A03g015748 [Arachis hypogaea]